MAYTMYTPLNVWLDPASVTDVVAYIQNYLSENTIYSEEEIEELIHDYLEAHPELIGGVQSVNGKTGTVVLTASDINTANNVTIESVLASLSSQISSIASSVATNTANITNLTGRVTTAETDISNLKSSIVLNKQSDSGQILYIGDAIPNKEVIYKPDDSKIYGRNIGLLNAIDRTTNGITFTTNTDDPNMVVLSGTSTNTAYSYGSINASNANIHVPAGTYYVCLFVEGEGSHFSNIRAYLNNVTASTTGSYHGNDVYKLTFAVDTTLAFRIQVAKGTNCGTSKRVYFYFSPVSSNKYYPYYAPGNLMHSESVVINESASDYIIYESLADNQLSFDFGGNVWFADEKTKYTLKNANTMSIFRKIVFCGDSYTSGYIYGEDDVAHPTNEDYAVPHYIQLLTGSDCINCGVSGANVLTWQTAERGLTKAQTSGKAQAYIISLGVNDGQTDTTRYVPVGTESDIGTDAQTYYGGLSQIIVALATINSDAHIFVNTNPNISNSSYDYSAYNEAVRNVVDHYDGTYNIHLIDLDRLREIYQVDSIQNDVFHGHMTAAGYELLAEMYKNILSDYINQNIITFRGVAFIQYDAQS